MALVPWIAGENDRGVRLFVRLRSRARLAGLTVPQKNRALHAVLWATPGASSVDRLQSAWARLTSAMPGRVFDEPLTASEGLVMIEWLIEAGASPNCADTDAGTTPLHIAVQKWEDLGDPPVVVELLIRLGARPAATRRGHTPLHQCATSEAKVKLLLRHFPEIVNQGRAAPIFEADRATFPLFVAAGANLTAIHPDGRSLLSYAPPGWAGYLILSGLNPRDARNRGVLFGVNYLSTSDVAALICAGANVRAMRDNWDTPLHIVCSEAYSGDDPVKARLLIRGGASTLARNNRGFTPLHYIADKGLFQHVHLELIEVLYEGSKNAKAALDEFFNGRSYNGDSPLHLAQAFSVIKLLVTLGADPNTRDAGGNTCLHIQARRLSPASVAFLLDNGAFTDVRNNAGETPLDVARKIVPKREQRVDLSQVLTLLEKTTTPSPVGKAAAKKK